ncbi:hypothetical protein SS50377_24080 [Spironucleus salmonicida]|nr:hypothetical protein SS50377_24080 [Spironucleus salmonicida]
MHIMERRVQTRRRARAERWMVATQTRQTRMQSARCQLAGDYLEVSRPSSVPYAAAPSRGSRRGAFGRHASRREELPSLAAPEVAKFHQRQLYFPMLVCSWPHSYVFPCFGQARGLRWVASEYAAACYAGTRLYPVRMPGPAKRSCGYGAGSRELGEESCQRGCWLRLSVKKWRTLIYCLSQKIIHINQYHHDNFQTSQFLQNNIFDTNHLIFLLGPTKSLCKGSTCSIRGSFGSVHVYSVHQMDLVISIENAYSLFQLFQRYILNESY